MGAPHHPTYAELAIVLFEVATNQARINEFTEQITARLDWGPNTSKIVEERRRLAQTLGEAHRALKEMSDHEQQIRALIARRSVRLRASRMAARFWHWLTRLENEPQRRSNSNAV